MTCMGRTEIVTVDNAKMAWSVRPLAKEKDTLRWER